LVQTISQPAQRINHSAYSSRGEISNIRKTAKLLLMIPCGNDLEHEFWNQFAEFFSNGLAPVAVKNSCKCSSQSPEDNEGAEGLRASHWDGERQRPTSHNLIA
jgi:hypothetical protein